MNRTIHKVALALSIGNSQLCVVPKNASFLDIQLQNGNPVLWVLVNADEEFVERHVQFFWTGRPAEEARIENYIGTIQSQGGLMVWHLFEVGSDNGHEKSVA
jgi:hypothetical protein